jgi:hypothetical protein
VESAAELVRFLGRLPLAEHGREVARIQQVAGLGIRHFEAVVATVRVVEALGQIARPRQRLDQHALDGVLLGERISAVHVVEADGGGLLGLDGAGGSAASQGEQA